MQSLKEQLKHQTGVKLTPRKGTLGEQLKLLNEKRVAIDEIQEHINKISEVEIFIGWSTIRETITKTIDEEIRNKHPYYYSTIRDACLKSTDLFYPGEANDKFGWMAVKIFSNIINLPFRKEEEETE